MKPDGHDEALEITPMTLNDLCQILGIVKGRVSERIGMKGQGKGLGTLGVLRGLGWGVDREMQTMRKNERQREMLTDR